MLDLFELDAGDFERWNGWDKLGVSVWGCIDLINPMIDIEAIIRIQRCPSTIQGNHRHLPSRLTALESATN